MVTELSELQINKGNHVKESHLKYCRLSTRPSGGVDIQIFSRAHGSLLDLLKGVCNQSLADSQSSLTERHWIKPMCQEWRIIYYSTIEITDEYTTGYLSKCLLQSFYLTYQQYVQNE